MPTSTETTTTTTTTIVSTESSPYELYMGIDVGKTAHYAAFASRAVFDKARGPMYKRASSCPTRKIDNTKEGFATLLAAICEYTIPDRCVVLMERTGHYGALVEQFLRAHGVTIYRMQARERLDWEKSDKKDSQGMALRLYNYLELGVIPASSQERLYPIKDATDILVYLRSLATHREKLVRRRTQCKNRLISLLDELFPEFTQAIKDSNCALALLIREKFPTPAALVGTPLDELVNSIIPRGRPGRKTLAQLQELAATTIGIKHEYRRKGLVFVQRQLIAELRLLNIQIDELEDEIRETLPLDRAGKILLSFPGVGAIHSAFLLSGIGSIANFETDSRLKRYLGYAPQISQTGTTLNSATPDKRRSSSLKKTMFMAALSAIRADPSWKAAYDRLVPRLCTWDEKKKDYVGKIRVVSRVANQMIRVMWVLLKKDYDLMATWDGKGEPPEPELYDPKKHLDRRKAFKVQVPAVEVEAASPS